MFNDLSTNNLEQEKDVLGGSRVLESDLYEFTIAHAFAGAAKSGARFVSIRLVTADGTTLDQEVYVTSSTANGGKNYYEKGGKQFPLPGFSLINNLCLLTVGKPLAELAPPEDKVLKLWDFDAKKELPTTKKCLVDLFGKQVIAGVIKQVVDKNKDTGNVDAQGKKIYAPTGETRETNEVDKFFRQRDGLTVAEIYAKQTAAEFKDEWQKKFKGSVKDRTTKTTGAPASGASAGVAGAAKPASSLFTD